MTSGGTGNSAAREYTNIITGCGSYLPDTIVTNEDLSRHVDTSDEWIFQRTGIRERRIAAKGQSCSDLGLIAAERALANAGISAEDIDLIVVATTTPDYTFPATAVIIQNKLGSKRGFAFDVQAVCSGFIYALNIADSHLCSGMATRALVIGAEVFSCLVDWSDRSTCVLFGDGAGAVVLERRKHTPGVSPRGIIAADLHSDGSCWDKLYADGGPSTTGTVGKVKMAGRDVFKHAVNYISDTAMTVVNMAEISLNDIDWFIPHQANRRIIMAVADKLGIPISKTVFTVDVHGNTSAASIPLAIDHANSKGLLKKGDLVLLDAMGGGFTWGAVLLRW